VTLGVIQVLYRKVAPGSSVLDQGTNPNRAPAWVFLVLALAMVIMFVVLFLTVPISGEDLRYRSTRYYGGPFGGFGGFGGFGL